MRLIFSCRAGQHYCMYCDRYFVNDSTLKQHVTTKAHRRRYVSYLCILVPLSALQLQPTCRKKIVETEKPYTQEEAEAAGGMAPADTAQDQTQVYARGAPGGALAAAAAAGALLQDGGDSDDE